MRRDEFIEQVQARAQLPSKGEAELATRATLETLGERVPESVASQLAAQLPAEIGEHLRRTEAITSVVNADERFGFEEFVQRVARRVRTTEPEALFRARVVLEVAADATSGVMPRVRLSLPEELRPLIDVKSTGQVRD